MASNVDLEAAAAAINFRKPVRSLQTLCQIEIVQNLHKTAAKLENDYMINFVENALSDHHKLVERMTDVRPDKVNTSSFVEDFEARLKSKEAAEEASKKRLSKGRNVVKNADGGKAMPKREGLRSSRPKPYEPESPSKKFLAALQVCLLIILLWIIWTLGCSLAK